MARVEDERRPFKDELSRERVAELARRLDLGTGFIAQACDELEDLELKQRVVQVSEALARHLPQDVPRALELLVERFGWGEPLNLWAWPLVRFVEDHGLEHPERSLDALQALTSAFSAEFAVRPYLRAYPDLTLQRLRLWRSHDSEHVRRLVSEGSRPRLPWGAHLKAFQRDPSPVLELIEPLLDDESEYVRRSVANNLNDIAKDHPQLVVDWCRQRMKPSRQRLIRHALRGLLKDGDPGAMALMGFGPPTLGRVEVLASSPVRIGQQVEITVVLESLGAQALMLDLAVEYIGSRGERTRRKVFKGGVRQATAGTLKWTKRLNMKQVSVRRLYPGLHAVELLVNGLPAGRAEFLLEET
jgi:3-methyladenine DNA glycosylase AlkC